MRYADGYSEHPADGWCDRSTERIRQLEAERGLARGQIVRLNEANAVLTIGVKAAELPARRSRRTALQDSNTLRDEISVLQRRRR